MRLFRTCHSSYRRIRMFPRRCISQWTLPGKPRMRKLFTRKVKSRVGRASYSQSMIHISSNSVSWFTRTLIQGSRLLEMGSPILILNKDKLYLLMTFREVLKDLQSGCPLLTQRVCLLISQIVMHLRLCWWDLISSWDSMKKESKEILIFLSFRFSKSSSQTASKGKEWPSKRILTQ